MTSELILKKKLFLEAALLRFTGIASFCKSIFINFDIPSLILIFFLYLRVFSDFKLFKARLSF